ncbi:MAG TPA: protein kinase [Pyrinomonadaceae bacterium]|nr:protein kinase [Pyrinomonadaceae bacterium]
MIQPGTLLQNRYRVAEQIGKGGMGEVYVATDERFQNRVAVKRTFFDDAEMSRAFRREARLLNHLRHAALPKVSDHFSEDGGQFLVMEFIEGSDLAELMKQRKVPFPLTEVLRWADELLDALEYLHAQEPPIIHRDIKPPNIKLTTDGKIVLLDFGLAKGAPSHTASVPASSVHGFSHNFAPLEQMEGSGTSPRSDLYSLAATLYFLLTGARPPDAVARAVAAIKEQPDPLRPAHLVQPQVPAAVGQILHRAMAQNPALRHASARELREALRLAAGGAARRELAPSKELPRMAPPPPASAPAVKSSEPDSPTVRERTQSHGLSQSLRPSSATGSSASLPESRRRTRPSGFDTASTGTASTRVGARAARPKALVACVLLICAAAGAYLLARPSETRTPAAVDNAEVQSPAPQQTDTVPGAVYSGPSQTAAGRNNSSQPAPARAAGETTEPDSNEAAESAGPTATGGQNTKEGGATAESQNAAAVTPTGRPALVIQNPAPAATPADEARRAQESRQQQPAYPPPYSGHPPPYPPPPPHGDRRPPPPDGRRPPPPHFRP